MANPYGVDRYGRPSGDGQTSPFTQRPRSPRNPTGNTGVTGYTNQPGGRTPPPVQQQQAARTSTPPGGEVTRQNVISTLRRYGAPTSANLTRAVQENPWLGAVTGSGGDKLRLSNGETWDVIHDVGGPNAAWQTLTGHTAAAAAAAQGGGAAVPLGSVTGAGPYHAGTLPTTPLQTYAPGQVPQYQAPNDYGIEARSAGLINQVLSNPTFDPATVAALKERNKEAELNALRESQGVAGGQFAALGRSDSGEALAANRDLRARTISDILAGNRDIDLNATVENANQRERALGLGMDFLNSLTSRAGSNYGNELQGVLAQEDLNQRGISSQNDAIQFALNRALAQEQLRQQEAGIGLQGQSLGLDARRLAEQTRQFNSQMNYNYGRDAQAYNQWLIDRVLNG